jgi:GNAT superfamily N-acetyltransferase
MFHTALSSTIKLCDKPGVLPMDEEPHIEQATLEDLPQLTDLLFDLFTQEADFVPNRAKQMRGLRLILEQPNRGRIFVLRQNGMILGMINLLFTISTAEGGFVILLEDVIVHRDHRGQGFGEKLLKHAIEYARKKDFQRITLLTDRLNEDGQRFFKAHGFHESHMVPMRLILNTSAGA